jgi:hypothetical protein
MHPTSRIAALLLVAGAVLAGCASTKDTAPPAGVAASDDADSNLGGAPTPTVTGQPQPSGNGGRTTTPGTARPSPSGPVVVYFRVKQKPECPKGTSKYPIPAVDLVVEWQVTGAEQVTLSVDGPGVYNTYGAKGSETFAWSCGGQPGTTVSHTYLLRAEAGGVEAKKTLTASAKVNEIPQV